MKKNAPTAPVVDLT
ncbi:hypothetical protein [Rhodococcus sp. H29-C3]|nr:hypothetical protein [Rhodococcus sp. H29-C3]MDJ0362325.1 hypothetical protein [Rhodococcus sp. H29-C3]